MIKANGVHSVICCIAIVFSNCDKRKRSRQGQWSNGNFTRLALPTIHFGHCQARGNIQTLSHEVYNLLSELCNRKQPEEKVPSYKSPKGALNPFHHQTAAKEEEETLERNISMTEH